MEKEILAALALVAMPVVEAADAPPVRLPDPVVSYIIEGNIMVSKVCIEKQFYLITRGTGGLSSGITPALKDGKPEQCDSSKKGGKQ